MPSFYWLYSQRPSGISINMSWSTSEFKNAASTSIISVTNYAVGLHSVKREQELCKLWYLLPGEKRSHVGEKESWKSNAEWLFLGDPSGNWIHALTDSNFKVIKYENLHSVLFLLISMLRTKCMIHAKNYQTFSTSMKMSIAFAWQMLQLFYILQLKVSTTF